MVYEYNAQVIRVIDGDTFEVKIDLGFHISIVEKIRLYGVDTPEIRTRSKSEKEKGLEAKKFVEDVFNNSSTNLKIKSYGRDKYGRILADFIIHDKLLSQLLLENNMAVEYMK